MLLVCGQARQEQSTLPGHLSAPGLVSSQLERPDSVPTNTDKLIALLTGKCHGPYFWGPFREGLPAGAAGPRRQRVALACSLRQHWTVSLGRPYRPSPGP